MELNKKEIIDHLQKHMNCIIKQGYDPNYMLGIFLYGSQNYGFADMRSDIDSIIVILPTFEDVCLGSNPISKEYSYGVDKEHIQVKDIRLYRQMLMKQNINFIETLFTDYYILNPNYELLFREYLINNREKIAHYNMNQTVESISRQLLHTLDGPRDTKKLYNANRLYIFIRDYLLGKPFLECIQPTGIEKDFLWQLKFKQSDLSKDVVAMDENAQNLEFHVQELLNEYPNIESTDQMEAETALNKGVVEIMKASFTQLKIDESGLTIQDFFNQLTQAEKKVYNIIAYESHGHGYVIITDLMERYGYSRTVYNNTLKKIKMLGVGTTEPSGYRGVFVDITHPQLKVAAEQSQGVE